jgi:NAD(P)-dependent dehydrogenase (short-subunit alcohol dehydrogenase family)
MITVNLDGKVAAVTAGTSGIGFAAAFAPAEAGAHVYVMGRREEELAIAARRIGSNATGDVTVKSIMRSDDCAPPSNVPTLLSPLSRPAELLKQAFQIRTNRHDDGR